jgi:hypothetical protein
MESVNKQECMRVLLELDMLTNKFVALEQENQKLLVDLQHVSTEKAQQHEELVMDKSHDMHVSMDHAQHSTLHACDGHALHHMHASIDHAQDTWHRMHTTCLHASLYK